MVKPIILLWLGMTDPTPPSSSVMPALIVKDAKSALRFYREGLGAKETARVEGPDGKIMHSTIQLGDSTIMVHDEFPEMDAHAPKPGQTHPVYLYAMVDDVDKTVEQAVKHGATLEGKIEDQFYGHRTGNLIDPFGHMWVLATETEEVDDEELKRRMDQMMQTG
jgi:PhnB protein